MEENLQDQLISIEGEKNLHISIEEGYCVFELKKQQKKEGDQEQFLEEQEGGVNKPINKTALSNHLAKDNKQKQQQANFDQPQPKLGPQENKQQPKEIDIDTIYDFLDWIEKQQKEKKAIFNSNPCGIEYEKEAGEIVKITIPEKFYNQYGKNYKKEECSGKVAFGNKLSTILSEFNVSENPETIKSCKDNLLSKLKDLNAVDKKEKQDKEKLVEKIKKVILVPLVPFALVNKKIQEYNQKKQDAIKQESNNIQYLRSNSDRFKFTSYEFNGLLHCEVSYIGDKKGSQQNGQNYGTSTILLEGSLKSKFLAIEKLTDPKKKLEQIKLLGSYFVSSGKSGAGKNKDTVPQLNLENLQGKQKVKFAVSVSPGEDNKIALVSYNIDKGILAEIKKDKNAMKKIEKDFYVKLPQIGGKDFYTKFTISRNNEGKLSISRDETVIFNNKFHAYGVIEKKNEIDQMNQCFEDAIVQIASSVERVKNNNQVAENNQGNNQQDGQVGQLNNEQVNAKKEVYVNNIAGSKEINLTGKNLLEKLNSSGKNNQQQK